MALALNCLRPQGEAYDEATRLRVYGFWGLSRCGELWLADFELLGARARGFSRSSIGYRALPKRLF